MEYVLKTKNLTKSFKAKNVVNQVSIGIGKKEIYGFIGRNGAGKSTFMKMVCGMLIPTSGEIELFGSKELKIERKRIGSVIENPAFYPTMTARENMIYYSKLMGQDITQIERLLEFVGLSIYDNKKTKLYSLGMKQRLSIAISLIGNSDFLILDEPTNGLDPTGIKEMRELLLRLNQEKNITILISSHILGELSKLATRYGIIESGNLVEEFSAKELEVKCIKYIKLKVDNAKFTETILLAHFNPIHYKIVNNNEINIYDNIGKISEINKILNINNVIVTAISTEGQDLEEYFVSKMGGGQ
jgi:ABC-2 type transport system ATP-binding protein